ncbi:MULTISPECIES: TIGR02530 family flagellar biosynthesis protein [Aneurinibacillus]|jgi:flagellar operon protein|uniref:Flagellar protein n=1 Tax=Aneurinibacillus danicus TaxID=267746 RepID=A0A511V5T7_9BACL|nr:MULTISPECIES: TIGR02530 family flagellar biosynthesis protein [Aneurinibacillus]GEN34099.1 flagellar protein [Aneurinibacillus danicus]
MNHIKAGHIFYPQPLAPTAPKKKNQSAGAFDALFQQKLNEAKNAIDFSNHALQRLEKRGIKLGSEDIAKLAGAVEKAQAKGAKESLVLMNNVAYIVSVQNRKVITAVDGPSMQENVFTNIDSAIIV